MPLYAPAIWLVARHVLHDVVRHDLAQRVDVAGVERGVPAAHQRRCTCRPRASRAPPRAYRVASGEMSTITHGSSPSTQASWSGGMSNRSPVSIDRLAAVGEAGPACDPDDGVAQVVQSGRSRCRRSARRRLDQRQPGSYVPLSRVEPSGASQDRAPVRGEPAGLAVPLQLADHDAHGWTTPSGYDVPDARQRPATGDAGTGLRSRARGPAHVGAHSQNARRRPCVLHESDGYPTGVEPTSSKGNAMNQAAVPSSDPLGR